MAISNDPGQERDSVSPSPLANQVTVPTINASSEDESEHEDEETIDNHHGYQQLPQEAPDATDDHSDSDSEELNQPSVETQRAMQFTEESRRRQEALSREEQAQLWAGQSQDRSDIVLDKDKVDTIKKVMSRISLPPSAVPQWASEITSDEWSDMVQKKLNSPP